MQNIYPILVDHHIGSHLVLLQRLVVQLRKEGIGVLEQFLGIIVLFECSALKHQDTVRVDHSIQPVRHSNDCTILERLVHRLVNHRLSPNVDVCCRLVDKHDPGRLENRPCDTDQLTLTHTQILTVFSDVGLEPLAGVHGLVQSALLQCSVQLLV
jgi:hypothetical protein